MNRRQLISAAVPSLGVLFATNRLALAKMKNVATPIASENPKPEIVLEDYSHEEALYLGTLLTWLELLEDSLDGMYEGIDALEDDSESSEAQAMLLMPLGVWKSLPQDAQKFDGPEVFALVQEYAVNAFTHLGSAADIISTGVVAVNPTALHLGTEHIYLANDEIGKLMAALPFERPRRDEFFS